MPQQQAAAGRPAAGHDPASQAAHQPTMMHPAYNMAAYQQYFQRAGIATNGHGIRMPNMPGVQQAANGQYLHGAWGVPTGRGAPMTMPIAHTPQQLQMQQQMMAHIRAQQQQAQAQQGQPPGQQQQGGVQR